MPSLTSEQQNIQDLDNLPVAAFGFAVISGLVSVVDGIFRQNNESVTIK